MQWIKPDFVEISLNMEVTAYSNSDDRQSVTAAPARLDMPKPGEVSDAESQE